VSSVSLLTAGQRVPDVPDAVMRLIIGPVLSLLRRIVAEPDATSTLLKQIIDVEAPGEIHRMAVLIGPKADEPVGMVLRESIPHWLSVFPRRAGQGYCPAFLRAP
jgi:hypothetical protein